MAGAAAAGLAQSQPDAAKPAAKKEAVKKTANPDEKTLGGYQVHQSIELGGRIAKVSGSMPMWDTTVNQSTGMRVLNQSLEMRSLNSKKTPLFDTLSTFATGFGGDPYDVARLNASKGRVWDFAGSFRRDRNFFDYNQFANSLDPLGPSVELVRQNDSMHLYNTVRRNSDMQFTLMPLSPVSFTVGYNHGTHEGPMLNTARSVPGMASGYTAEVFEWFRNSEDTYSFGLVSKPAPRTTVNLDEYVVSYKGDSAYTMANPSLPLWNATAGYYQVSANATPGVAGATPVYATPGYTLTSVTTAAKCGEPAYTGGGITVPLSTQAYFTNGMMSAFCKGAVTDNLSMPSRSFFPTEQLRFASHYWEKVSANGRLSYSGGHNNLNSFTWLQQGFTATAPKYTTGTGWNTDAIGSITTGSGGGKYGSSHRARLDGDLGLVAEVTRQLSISESYTFNSYRTDGFLTGQYQNYTIPTGASTLAALPSLQSFAGTTANVPWPSGAIGGAVTALTTSAGYNAGFNATSGNVAAGSMWFMKQQNSANTLLGTYIVNPTVKVSAGWRIRNRELNYASLTGYVPTSNMNWRGNEALLGVSVNPSNKMRMNANYEHSAWSAGTTTTPTFTRQEPQSTNHIKVRTVLKPAQWINFSATGNLLMGRNDDALVKLATHNEDVSFAASIRPTETLSFDLSWAYDEAYSVINSCFQWAATSPADGYGVPFGATNAAGTCAAVTTTAGASVGGTAYYLYNSYYKSPSSFYLASFNYTPVKMVRLNGGFRYNQVHGTADILNPVQNPGALDSRTLMPFADAEFKVAQQWAWHGNYSYNGYGEQGTANFVTNGFTSNGLPSRNNHGNVLTLGVKYAF
jgi:hypothetical protein